MEWLRTDAFMFNLGHPNYADHLMIMGQRSDGRVYYTHAPLPSRLPEYPAMYSELKAQFNKYLEVPVTTEEYSETGYGLLVEQTLARYKGIVLDTFPDGE